MKAVRAVLGWAALGVAITAALLGVVRWHWPKMSELLGAAAVVLGAAAWQTPVGRHGGRRGAHARPPLLDEAREAAAGRAAERAETAAVRAVIDPALPPPPAPEPAVPAVAGRMPPVAVMTATAPEPVRPRPLPWPDRAEQAEQAAVALAIAAIPQGTHHRAGVWGAPPDCPDPARCGRSPWCPGDRPGCLDPAPFNSYGRAVLAPGKIPVYAKGRHESETEEAKS